jgi:hypothetical protein
MIRPAEAAFYREKEASNQENGRAVRLQALWADDTAHRLQLSQALLLPNSRPGTLHPHIRPAAPIRALAALRVAAAASPR